MTRLFFGDIPEGPTCSACGASNPVYVDDVYNVSVCDEGCYVEWFVENKAKKFALDRFYEECYEID